MQADHSVMGKIDRAIELLKASWGVIRNDKELLVLPAISGVCALGVIAMFAYPVITMVLAANESGMAEGEVAPVEGTLAVLEHLGDAASDGLRASIDHVMHRLAPHVDASYEELLAAL